MSLMRTASLVGLFGLAVFSANDASAQQIYRIVGPDGKVTFSDKPPLDPNARPSAMAAASQGGGSGNSALPFELRQVADRYPVVLYSGPQCGPCGTGRSLLTSRGIPFTEKTVSTNEDIDALGRLTGAPTLPVLTIGEQQLKGYSEVEWAKFLDAAGYPKSSLLPPGYAGPPPTPLVVAQQPQVKPKPANDRPQAAVPQPETATAPPPDNPAGIRF
jgi:glutaredoxin